MPLRMTHFDESFPHAWQVQILDRPPLIAPAGQYVYPQAVDEVEIGALLVLLRAHPQATSVLATFALGFEEQSLPHGIWSCPNPDQLCAIAGGYAYLVQADRPEEWLQIPYRPVVSVHPVPEHALLIFASFHKLWALGSNGMEWETKRLSWEGLRVTEIQDGQLFGFGWDMNTDAEVAFAVDLTTGTHSGGVD